MVGSHSGATLQDALWEKGFPAAMGGPRGVSHPISQPLDVPPQSDTGGT